MLSSGVDEGCGSSDVEAMVVVICYPVLQQGAPTLVKVITRMEHP